LFQDDNFYASADESRWEYSKTTELELIETITGQSLDSMSQQATLVPLHLWRGKDTLTVEDHDLFKSVFPFISLQKISNEQWSEIIGISLGDYENNISTGGMDADKLIDEMDKLFRGDAVGTVFALYLQQRLVTPVYFPNTKVELVEVQKVGNVLYAQSLVTLQDVTVDEASYSQYYIRQEIILVSTPTDFYLMNTSIPGPELVPRGEYFTWVNAWFGELAIIIK
jgi:hypothetical protein